VIICGSLAAQLALDRRDLRHYADEQARSEARYRAMAHTDALTGLANRRELLRALHEEAVGGPPCVLLAIDLDGFKNINDTRGHDVGDALLVEVAERLRTNLRPGDLAVRVGGDEFAVLMWARPAGALMVAQRLLRVLSRPYELSTGTAFVSASIGLAGCATADDVPTLLRNADLALRFAKQRGKCRVERYDQAYDAQVRRRTELEHELRGAAERGELMVVYQPVVRLPDAEHRYARVTGVEALVRWHHPRLGAVPPEQFLPVAEESGIITAMGSFVLHEACHQLSRWQADGHDLWLSVNVSVRELHTPEYATALAEVLRRHRLAGDRLVVEVTEHAVAVDLAQVVERLTALRATGVRVALDDFGSRYSSLAQLRELPVDILKIDRSFLDADRFTGPLVDVVVNLGRRLGLEVIAEGISEPAQLRLLQEAGCRYAQGALLGVALPAERVEAVLGTDLPPPAGTAAAAPTAVQHVRPVDSAHEMRQS
jgi:diguanylate cyclase (GGDEF)-like protein